MTIINVLGIDPSQNNTGLAVCQVDIMTMKLVGCNEIVLASTERQTGKTVRKSSDDLRRAQSIIGDIRDIIRARGIRIVAAEVPSGAQSASASFANGMCVGILAGIRTPMVQVTPTETKVASVGTKTATKPEVIRWALDRFPDAGWMVGKRANDWGITDARGLFLGKANEHLADAIAIVEAALLTPEMRLVLTAMRPMDDDGD